jgi:hypothetical protein
MIWARLMTKFDGMHYTILWITENKLIDLCLDDG